MGVSPLRRQGWPIYCDDSVAPAGPTLRYARRAPRSEVIRYPVGHFAIYQGEPFEQAIGDQLDFLQCHPPARGKRE
jgi:hypothetical protein